MERNDTYTVFENPETLKIPFLHSYGCKLLLFGLLLLVYGVVFAALFAGNTLSFSDQMQQISSRQSAWYSGYQSLPAVWMNLNNYLNASDQAYLEGFEESSEEVEAFIGLLSREEAGVYAHDMARLCEQYLGSAREAISFREAGNNEEMLGAYEKTEEIQRLITAFSSYSMKEMEDAVSADFSSENEKMLLHLKQDIAAMLLVTAVIVAAAILIFRYFLVPLHDLTTLILGTSTETWEIREAPETRRDEMGLMIRAFYGMMNKISLQFRELLCRQQLESELLREKEKNIQTEALLARSELKVFQSQINSHFLFNTLNLISKLADLEQAFRVQNAVQLLASFLRTVLDQFNRVVTLSEEFDNIRDYVEIQKLRFGERICFEEDMDVDLEWFQLPSMTLQPLVENSFGHGISGRKQGYIRCVAEKEGDDVLLYVWDDGAGLDEETRIWLEKSLESGEAEEGERQCIGLANVYRRLSLYYPGKVKPILEGEKEKYAKIGFRICSPEEKEFDKSNIK